MNYPAIVEIEITFFVVLVVTLLNVVVDMRTDATVVELDRAAGAAAFIAIVLYAAGSPNLNGAALPGVVVVDVLFEGCEVSLAEPVVVVKVVCGAEVIGVVVLRTDSEVEVVVVLPAVTNGRTIARNARRKLRKKSILKVNERL